MGAMAVLVTLALSGCTRQPAAPLPTTTTTDARVFASDAEALAAATAAYAAYQEMSSLIGHEGGSLPERMSRVSAGEALESETASFVDMASKGLRGVGELAFDSLTVQSADLSTGMIQAYLCLDVSKTDVVDANGESSIPADRATRFPLHVNFVLDTAAQKLIVDTSESWSGKNFC